MRLSAHALQSADRHNGCMEDKHPINHPLVYICILLFCTIAVGVANSQTAFKETGVSPIWIGVIFGFPLGILVSIIWWCLITLADP